MPPTDGDDSLLRRTLRRLEPALLRAYQRLTYSGGPGLEGDRDVEYSFIEAHCPPGPGDGLDLGCGTSHLALLAARRGFRMTAIDLRPVRWPYAHPNLAFRQTDLFDLGLSPSSLDLVINCSTVEHIGLGRYGDDSTRDGDLAAMRLLASSLRPSGTMLLTVPAGRDAVFEPWHRVYGEDRLPRLLEGYRMEREEFWTKDAQGRWTSVPRSEALSRPAQAAQYGLGCFVLKMGPS